jgi:hypothetical protein
MSRSTKRLLRTLCLLGASVATIGPAVSQSGQTITLRVPVELKEMTALGAIVWCGIYRDGSPYTIGETTHSFPIPFGEFNEELELAVDPHPGLSFAQAVTYRCRLRVANEPSPALSDAEEPYVGTPAGSWDVYRIAKPDEFFQSEITGPISGVALPPGPGQLQVAPNN